MAKLTQSKPKIKIAINGLGRIGRVFLRIAHNNPHFKIVGINSRSGLDIYAHLLKYDTAYGTWDNDVKVKGNNLVIDGQNIPFIQDTNRPPAVEAPGSGHCY